MNNESYSQRTIFVTSSGNSKQEIYRSLGYSVSGDKGLIAAIGRAEKNYDEAMNNGIIVPNDREGSFGFSYPVDISIAKALGLIEELRRRPRQHSNIFAVTDSVWMLEDGFLNKPYSIESQEQLFELYLRRRGSPIGGAVGVSFVRLGDNGLLLIQPREINLGLGVINPNLNPEVLRRIIINNPHIAGGMSWPIAIDHGIIIPPIDENILWMMRDYSEIPSTSLNPSFTGVEPKPTTTWGRLSFDATNQLSILGLLFGAEP